MDQAFDFSAVYKVAGHGGIAWRATHHPKFEQEYDPGIDGEDAEPYIELLDDEDRVVCHMVGDDSDWTFDIDDLTRIEEEDYCPECGQIGCHAIR